MVRLSNRLAPFLFLVAGCAGQAASDGRVALTVRAASGAVGLTFAGPRDSAPALRDAMSAHLAGAQPGAAVAQVSISVDGAAPVASSASLAAGTRDELAASVVSAVVPAAAELGFQLVATPTSGGAGGKADGWCTKVCQWYGSQFATLCFDEDNATAWFQPCYTSSWN